MKNAIALFLLLFLPAATTAATPSGMQEESTDEWPCGCVANATLNWRPGWNGGFIFPPTGSQCSNYTVDTDSSTGNIEIGGCQGGEGCQATAFGGNPSLAHPNQIASGTLQLGCGANDSMTLTTIGGVNAGLFTLSCSNCVVLFF